MNGLKLSVIGLLFVVWATKVQAQQITVPIHYSKWIQNYSEANLQSGLTSFAEIPIGFYMDSASGKAVQYEKLEIGINLPDEAEKLIHDFIKNGNGINPFDPEQIKITAYFAYENSSKKKPVATENRTIFDLFQSDAFYYEEFVQEMNDTRFKHGYWKKDTTSFNFRVRFAPRKTGWWKCTINIFLEGKVKYTLPTFDFLCIPGNSKGFITGISKDKRLLQFENGENFFGIGQNIPCADMPNAVRPAAMSDYREQPPQGYNLQRSYIADLAANGGNLIRIMNGEWNDAPEWEKLNDYSMNLCFAYELDRTFDLCLEKNVFIIWTQSNHTSYMYHNPYGNDRLGWPHNPYHLELKLEKPEDFFTNEKAIKIYKNKIRYMLSRWGYSRMIAGIQPMNEINEMAADPVLQTHPYFTDTAFRNDVGNWFREIKNYIQKDLGYPLLVGSSFTGGIDAHFGDDPIMRSADFNDYHPYIQNRNRNIYDRFGGINLVPGWGIFKRYKKPVILAEMGTSGTEFLFECNENEFHNDLWGTAFLGGWGGGLHWHNWEDNYSMNLRSNFIGLHSFLKNIDFTNYEWAPNRWPEKDKFITDSTYAVKKENYFESVYLTGKKNTAKNTEAAGWIHNRSAYWYNYPETDCEKTLSNKRTNEKKGKKYFRPGDDDNGGVIQFKWPEDKDKMVIYVNGLQRMKKYTICFFNTSDGKYDYSYSKFHWFGKMKIQFAPDILDEKHSDAAFYVVRKKDITYKIKF
jgi:hypothetical protein